MTCPVETHFFWCYTFLSSYIKWSASMIVLYNYGRKTHRWLFHWRKVLQKALAPNCKKLQESLKLRKQLKKVENKSRRSKNAREKVENIPGLSNQKITFIDFKIWHFFSRNQDFSKIGAEREKIKKIEKKRKVRENRDGARLGWDKSKTMQKVYI